MMSAQFFGSVAFGWYLHCFFATLLFIGIVLLIVWMVKNLNKKDLFRWVVVLLVLGVLGTVLTMNASFSGWKAMMDDDVDFEQMMNFGTK